MMARFSVLMFFVTLAYAAIFVGPAFLLTGDPWWVRGWLAVGTMAVLQTAGGLWLARANAGLLEERTGMRPQSGGDKLASAILLSSMLVWAVLVPVDVFYLRLMPPMRPYVSLGCGAAMFALGAALNIWVMRVNSFAASTVKIQKEREHYVVDTGPYAVVRHPMYSSFILILAGMALMMESVAMALAAIPLVLLGFLLRMLVEETSLRKDLPGHAGYTHRVSWRVIPFLF